MSSRTCAQASRWEAQSSSGRARTSSNPFGCARMAIWVAARARRVCGGYEGPRIGPLARAMRALPAHDRTSCPDRSCGLDDAAQFGALVSLREGVAGGGGGKTALRPEPQPIKINELRRFARAPLKILDGFQCRRLGADEAEHHALIPWHEAQGLEVARTGAVVLKQEMRDARVGKEALRNRFIAALREITAAEIATAH